MILVLPGDGIGLVAHLLPATRDIPNHPRWPLLIYPNAVAPALAQAFEELFTRKPGVIATARAGDVIVLPAGTGHKRVSSRGALGVVGAYPQGSTPDTCTRKTAAETIVGVPLPACDPVFGAGGPLFEHWK